MAHASSQGDGRALDKHSALAGAVLSRLVLEHSPVLFPCRFGSEDMVLLDLIGRYRLPIQVIAWDVGLDAGEALALRSFVERRYVFAAPLRRVDVDRLRGLGTEPAQVDALELIAVQLSGCRAWLTGARRELVAAETATPTSVQDEARKYVRCNPLIDWDAALVAAYLRRWDLPGRSPEDDLLRAA